MHVHHAHSTHVPLALLWLCKRAPRNFGKSGKSNFRLNARGLESCTKPAHRATGWQAATSKVHRYRVHANVLRVPAAAGRSGLVQRTFHCSQQLEVEYVRGKPKYCIGKLSIVHTGRAARAGKALNSKYRCERSRGGEHVEWQQHLTRASGDLNTAVIGACTHCDSSSRPHFLHEELMSGHGGADSSRSPHGSGSQSGRVDDASEHSRPTRRVGGAGQQLTDAVVRCAQPARLHFGIVASTSRSSLATSGWSLVSLINFGMVASYKIVKSSRPHRK